MKNKKYDNLVADIELMIEKFEEIQGIYYYQIKCNDDVERCRGGISAYNNAIGVLKNLVEKDWQTINKMV